MPAMIHKSCHDSKAVAQFQRLVVRGKYMWMTPHARRNNYFNNLEQLFGNTGHSDGLHL